MQQDATNLTRQDGNKKKGQKEEMRDTINDRKSNRKRKLYDKRNAIPSMHAYLLP